jgi:UDP-N-acetylmuramoylalanine--D-glutamate ligase
MNRDWKDINVVVLGLSRTGEAAAKYLKTAGAQCMISEKRNTLNGDLRKIENLEALGIAVEMGGNKQETILKADVVVTSPGIPPSSEVIQLIKSHNIELISEPELAFRETTIPILAVTGTNGKSTTTSLISSIFSYAGKSAPFCGNIGYPIINEVQNEHDYLIAEMSSFQLEYSQTFKPAIAVFLNYTADHVDWHGSEEEYLKSKTAFLKGSRSPEWVVLNACDPVLVKVAENNESKQYWFGKETEGFCSFIKEENFVLKEEEQIIPVLKVSEVKLIGNHNYQNIMAAIAATRIAGLDLDKIAGAVREFESIEHRLEYVTDINGVAFYNDSKATNCDSTICALKAFKEQKIVLIAGGRDKGTDLTELVTEIKKHTNAVILIGEATKRFADALTQQGYKNIYKEETLEDAVNKAYILNQGAVVLSPACASYDMFKNFEERGHVFKDIVNKKRQENQ